MLELRPVDGAREIIRIPADFVVPGRSYDFELEVVATEAHSTAQFAAEIADYLKIDIGGGFSAVPDDVQNGFDLGPFSAAERKPITLRLTVPEVTPPREKAIGILLGIGV